MKTWKIAIVAAVLFAGLPSARADYPCGPYLNYGGWYQHYGLEHIPYFSLHPPVYYSLPVPRTYGYSPFAYPPGTMTPDIAITAPTTIINPHVPQEPKKAKPVTSNTAVITPKIILNPYVTQPSTAAPVSATAE